MSDSIGAAATTSTLRIIVLFVCASILAAVGLSIWNQYSSSNYDSKQDSKISTVMMQQTTDYNTLSAQIVILNSTIYAQVGELNVKIMLVNTTIYSELDLILSNLTNIYEILNISSGNATSFTQYVNNSLITITGDINNLQMNVSNLYGNITVLQGSITDIYSNLTVVWGQLDNLEATKLETINGVPGDTVNKNVNLVSVNDNLIITPSPGNNTVYFNVPESLMKLVVENGTVVPNEYGEIYVTGGPDGLIDVNYTGPNTLIICATGVQAVLQSQDSMIMSLTAQMVAQNATINSLDARITVLESFIMNILNLNITGNLNVSIATLIYNVTVLQADVVDLQNQINLINSNTSSVPVGTIVPFGGSTFMNISNVPIGYLACDGSTYSIASYMALWAVIGNVYCSAPPAVGDFCVPDLRGKVPVGQNSGTFGTRGAIPSVGSETHTLNVAETALPGHTHTVPAQSGTTADADFNILRLGGGSGYADLRWCEDSVGASCNTVGTTYRYMQVFGSGTTQSNRLEDLEYTIASQSTLTNTEMNSTTPFNIVQPSLVVNYIIKY